MKPPTIVRAQGCYFWDDKGKRYLDFAAQLVNVNAGHQHPKIVEALKAQAEKLCYIGPTFSTEIKGELARLIAEVTPGNLKKTFFTLGGADANDFAVRLAKWYTGKPKVIARYRSYHGASYGAMSLTGDWRRAYSEPGMPGALHCFQPYCYRCTFGQEPSSCKRECLSSLEEMIEFENPEFIAAVIVESVTGPSNGLYVPPDDYLPRLRAICDRYGILLIADEVMSGWGRTGRWFAVDNYGVVPDLLTTAKGLTNSMAPLGAVVVSEPMGEWLEDHTLWGGLTYGGHPLSCAAGVAALQVYREEGLVENSRVMGKLLLEELQTLKAKHPSVGDARGIGLFCALELVKNRQTRELLVPMKEAPYEAGGMAAIKKALSDGGVYTFTRPNLIAVTPPLCITEAELREGLAVVDRALDVADSML
jgi:taurine--2-oxoglutarate transaminase